MNINDFDYNLPEELIAQTPLEERCSSKLMLLNKENGNIEHKNFKSVIDCLNFGDVLVLNDTKVIPARLIGVKVETNATIEFLLLKDLGENKWECLSKPAKRLQVGTIVSFGDSILKAKILEKKDEGITIIELFYDGILYEILDELGEMPLPPYIHEKLDEQDRYQTVYAKNIGSAAAPTAGLHFTKEFLDEIKAKGIIVVYVTLHVGLGTFRPVQVDNVLEHEMHSEYYQITDSVAEIINSAKQKGNKVFSVGTTSTRVLETCTDELGVISAGSGNTQIFIYPGYKFKMVDGLITNFHLPKSTLLMLVSALSDKEYILNAYKEAINNKYRFFSFGDAMFIH